MDPVIPPEGITTQPTRREAHSDCNNRQYACHICRDAHDLSVRIVWSIAESGLCSEDIDKAVSDIANSCYDRHTKCFVKRAIFHQARLQDCGRILGIALTLDVEESATDERQALYDAFKLSLSAEHIHILGKNLTPHGGIRLNASVAVSGAAFTVKVKAIVNSTNETARCQNITEYWEDGLKL